MNHLAAALSIAAETQTAITALCWAVGSLCALELTYLIAESRYTDSAPGPWGRIRTLHIPGLKITRRYPHYNQPSAKPDLVPVYFRPTSGASIGVTESIWFVTRKHALGFGRAADWARPVNLRFHLDQWYQTETGALLLHNDPTPRVIREGEALILTVVNTTWTPEGALGPSADGNIIVMGRELDARAGLIDIKLADRDFLIEPGDGFKCFVPSIPGAITRITAVYISTAPTGRASWQRLYGRPEFESNGYPVEGNWWGGIDRPIILNPEAGKIK